MMHGFTVKGSRLTFNFDGKDARNPVLYIVVLMNIVFRRAIVIVPEGFSGVSVRTIILNTPRKDVEDSSCVVIHGRRCDFSLHLWFVHGWIVSNNAKNEPVRFYL